MYSLKDMACIAGVGETPYVRGTGSGMSDLGLQLLASRRAIEDAGLKVTDIDGIIAPLQGGKYEDFVINFGIQDIRWAVTVHMGGAAHVAALGAAATAIATGQANYILIPGGWNGYSGMRARDLTTTASDMAISYTTVNYYVPFGSISAPNQYGLIAMRYIQEYNIKPEQTGAVAVACRKHAQLNPKAVMYGRPMTMDDYLNSPMISSPFRLFDCCLETDGGAAVVVTSPERARDLKQRPVYIMGVASGAPYPVDELVSRKDFIGSGLSKAAPRAWAMAGVGPKDMDFLMSYDSFTFNVLRHLEEGGFCKPGEAGAFVEGGRIELGGELPVNTHGGLLSEAHVTAMNHIVEAVRQLRGTEGPRQVQGAKMGAVVAMGGGWGTAAMGILRQ